MKPTLKLLRRHEDGALVVCDNISTDKLQPILDRIQKELEQTTTQESLAERNKRRHEEAIEHIIMFLTDDDVLCEILNDIASYEAPKFVDGDTQDEEEDQWWWAERNCALTRLVTTALSRMYYPRNFLEGHDS